MSEILWTDTQRRAISTIDRSVLVSAGAGSGKTAVLAERCAALGADARLGCGIDRVLVVTFTDAAASEMRSRIAVALRSRLARTPANPWLQRQLALLDGAAISTLHSFCRQILGKYFAHADLDPLMPLLDPADGRLLRKETAQEVFDEYGRREDAEGEAFVDFVCAYGPTSEQALIECVLQIDEFLNSIVDPEAWLQQSLDALAEGGRGLSDVWSKRLADVIDRELYELSRLVESHLAAMTSATGPVQDCRKSLAEFAAALDGWRSQLRRSTDDRTLDAVCHEGIGKYKFPKIPRRSDKLDRAALGAIETLYTIRDDLFRKRLCDCLGPFTVADWADGLARIRPQAEILVTLVRAVRDAYQKAKAGLGVMDFGDLERRARNLLADESNHVAAQLRDRFQHVLVDEFQDISPVQADVLRLVSREAEADRPANLFTVGDVKQSIYRFRLAEPMLFLNRRGQFAPGGDRGAAIDLVENFRSRPRLLDAINALMERLMAADLGGIDYDDAARLRPGPCPPGKPVDETTPVELHLLEDKPGAVEEEDEDNEPTDGGAADWLRIEREAYVVAQRIKALVAEGAAYRDIVILLRSMKARVGAFARTLSRAGIPVYTDTAGGFFETREVRDLLSLLTLLDNAQQDIPLAAVLRSPLFGQPLTDDELVAIRIAARGPDADARFHVAVAEYARSGSDTSLRPRLANIFERIDRWRQCARRRPLADVLWQIYEESGYLAYAEGLADGRRRRANLLQLHEYARQFGGFRRQGLYRFLRFIDGLEGAGEDLEPGTPAAPGGDVVRIMSIHRSKGLEFPIVILGELGKDFNLQDARGSILFDRKLGLALKAVDLERRITYPTLPHQLVARAIRTESLAEELRIFYVALTRAKQRIILVGSHALDRLQELRDRLAAHRGPLPLSDRLGAGSVMDWTLAALACQPAPMVQLTPADLVSGAPLFAVCTYDFQCMKDWKLEVPPPTRHTELLEKCAALGDLPTPAPDSDFSELVRTIERRLVTPYPAMALTRVPAVAAATTLKRRWDAMVDPDEPTATWAPAHAAAYSGDRFRPPSSLHPATQVDPTARGTWTHEFLQRVDFRRPCDAADLAGQLSALSDAGLNTAAQAAQIDLDAIAWFFQTPLGQRLRQEKTRVLREWPFVIGVDPSRYEPGARRVDTDDVLLVRGILDGLFDSGEGWEILDYKTDGIDAAQVPARVEEYRGQLGIYAAAVKAVWQSDAKKRWLVFLTPRRIVEV
ncbi:MAG TPA: helicase-exonuclease AddAB subunit AddA [Phycisphaerae bacterium]|nr:helicase-exonuclease AddAB subunit AddA [Phycisphaerae bacterium]